MNNHLFYRPDIGVAADFIPYYEDGVFYLYYLHDYRDKLEFGEGTPWDLITTTDFVHFEEHGEVLSRGQVRDQDLYVYTGCVYKEAEKKYHIFYTGHNPHFRKQGKAEQAVMHAISSDLIHWQKVPEDTFYAPKDQYEEHDWRDPFVYLDDEAGHFKMLLAARTKEGLSIRRGCTAVCHSNDLKTWTVAEPIWTPNQFFTHECPDLFQIGEWWYLIYSEFTDRCMTRYVMSKDRHTWRAPRNDVFDGRAFYAAKTAASDKHRYLFGWIPTKEHNDDHREWQWGGNLLVHEIIQLDDGELGVRLPSSIAQSFQITTPMHKHLISSPVGYKHVLLDALPCCSGRIDVRIVPDENVTSYGILINYDAELDAGYAFEFNERILQFGFGMQPNTPWNYSNFHNVWLPYERKPEHYLTILLDHDLIVAYLDDTKALSTRVHNHSGGLGLYAIDGTVTFTVERWTQSVKEKE